MTARTEARYDAFLADLALHGIVARACRTAGLDRAGTYKRYRENPEFAERWDAAMEEATDGIEEEARRRAVEGVEEPVFFQGAECGRVRKYSDSLMALLLKANRAKFKDRVEVGNVPGEAFKVEESPTQLARRLAFVFSNGLQHAKKNPEGSSPTDASGEDLA